jgi:hypothetical protein
MEPLNKIKRRIAFSRFLLFYLGTLTVITVVTYFSVKVIAIKNEIIKSKATYYNSQVKSINRYANLLDTINNIQKFPGLLNEKASVIIDSIQSVSDEIDFSNGLFDHIPHVLAKNQAIDKQIYQHRNTGKQNNTRYHALAKTLDSLNAELVKCKKEVRKKSSQPKNKPKEKQRPIADTVEKPKEQLKPAAAPVDAPKAPPIDYNVKLKGMLDSVIKYKKPDVNAFTSILCEGQNTKVVIYYGSGPDNKKRIDKGEYALANVHLILSREGGAMVITSVTTEIDKKNGKDCIKRITIIWKYNGRLFPNKKLFNY